jgi:hypothetical protein
VVIRSNGGDKEATVARRRTVVERRTVVTRGNNAKTGPKW